MIDTAPLQEGKNLLAFSAGVDSSALFFLLLEHNITFDIALVNYGTRESSNAEESYAKKLASLYGLRVHTVRAPRFESRFEEQARAFRYRYFESLIEEHGYGNLLTAHQLNDRLEWFLMRLVRGAGVSELLGMESVTERTAPTGTHYRLIRPLLGYTKEELLHYLDSNHHRYFFDESNKNMKYERNLFRHRWSDSLIEAYSGGIKRSFSYLERDKRRLTGDIELLHAGEQLRIVRVVPSQRLYAADRYLKELGYLLSGAQRGDLSTHTSTVIGGIWAVEYSGGILYIAPYLKEPMPKVYKERCRIAGIPPKIRPYCYVSGLSPEEILHG